MKKILPFYIVDVFAEEKYAGNQLAVLRHTKVLDTETMQKIAKETNFAETTFIHTDEKDEGGYHVRIFTPVAEMPFAGHPTLGTAYVIRQFIQEKKENTILLNLKVGQIPVQVKADYYWMRQINPVFGSVFSKNDVKEVLGIDATDIDGRFPIEEVSTGIPFLIVPMKQLSAVKKVKINLEKLRTHLNRKDSGALAIFVFCPETYHPQNDLNCRMFADELGVAEDAATGSANGCLLGYLLKNNYFGTDKINIQVEQGYEMNRPSLLKHSGKKVNETIYEINIGGKVQMIAQGDWIL